MRLLNLNVCIKKDNTDKILELIKETNADICTFQEVMNALEKNCYNMYDVYRRLITKELYEFHAYAPLWRAKCITQNGKVIRDFGGYAEQGSLLLSKYKIVESLNEFYYNNYKFEYDFTNFKELDWCRSIQNSIIEINNRLIQIINVHGIWTKNKSDDERTLAQTDFILSKIRNDLPVIVVGDFNLLPETKSIQILSKHLKNLVTEYNIKSSRPSFNDGLDVGDMVCDYIFVNEKIFVDNFAVINNLTSDHFPYIFDFHI